MRQLLAVDEMHETAMQHLGHLHNHCSMPLDDQKYKVKDRRTPELETRYNR